MIQHIVYRVLRQVAHSGDQPQIGKLIRELRLETGLTQEQFAAELGVTYSSINRWENRRSKPSPLAMQKIEGMLRQMGGGRSPSRRHRGQDLLSSYFPRD